MKALVTGGGGFLGLYIVEQLLERGDEVRVFCRGEYERLNELRVECVRGDIRDAAIVASACEGIDTVLHVAAVPGVWGPWDYYHSINTVGTENVIAGCHSHGVQRLVYTSSPSVVYDGKEHINANESLPYPDSYLCHYPHSKALAEQAVIAANGKHGLATCSLRPHLIWGPRDNHLIPRLIQRAKSGRLRRVGNGENLVSMSYVENTAAAHIQAADKLSIGSPVAGQCYFINEPEPVNLWQWIDELLALGGLPPVQKSMSERSAMRIGMILERLYATLRIKSEPPMTQFIAAQLSSSHHYDVSKAEGDFGYEPAVSVAEAMTRLSCENNEFGGR